MGADGRCDSTYPLTLVAMLMAPATKSSVMEINFPTSGSSETKALKIENRKLPRAREFGAGGLVLHVVTPACRVNHDDRLAIAE